MGGRLWRRQREGRVIMRHQRTRRGLHGWVLFGLSRSYVLKAANCLGL